MGRGVSVILDSEMDQTLKRVNGELRMIGSRLDRIDQKLPKFDLKIKDLKEEEDKVARYWSEVETDHEKTFLRTQRRLDNTHERRVEAEERRRGRPLWNHHHTRHADGPDYLALRMEVPVWVQQKYKSSAVSTKNDPEMQTFLRSMRDRKRLDAGHFKISYIIFQGQLQENDLGQHQPGLDVREVQRRGEQVRLEGCLRTDHHPSPPPTMNVKTILYNM